LRLNKMGVLIRSSSKSTVTARARRFASQYPELVRIADYEDRAYIALQFLYPNASRTLRQQLVDSMGDRYAKLRYETFRSKANYASAASSRNDRSAMQKAPTSHVSHRLIEKNDKAQEERQVAHIVIPASSIDTACLPLNLEEAVFANVRSARVGKTLIGNDGRLREPDLPSFKQSENFASCGWCHQVLNRSVLHATRKGWSAEGRRHYLRDLQPYMCLSEGCRESRPSFASSFEWFNHMESDHTDSWSSRIHNQPAWMCIAKHENDSVYTFSSKDELLNHIRAHQCKTWVCTGVHENHSTSAFSSRDALSHHILHDGCDGKDVPDSNDPKYPECLVQTSRQSSSCPLCLFSVDDQSLDDRSASGSDGKENLATSRAMGSHIADHLHHVMIISLQIMSVMQGPYDEGDGDTLSQPSALSTVSSDSFEESMEKRLNDLPENVQGSIGWSDTQEDTGIMANRLNDFFADDKQRNVTYTDSEIQQISFLLSQDNLLWSKVPRTYIVLRTIDCLDSLDYFIRDGIRDILLPLTEREIPSCISPSKHSQFMAAQDLIMTKSMYLEKGQHCFYGEHEILPLKMEEHLGSGSSKTVDRVRSFISYREYALKRISRRKLTGEGRLLSTKRILDIMAVVKRTEHRHLEKFVGSFIDPESIGLIMSPAADANLSDYLSGPMIVTPMVLRTWFGCLVRALEYLHRETIRHDNIKPSTILVHHGNVRFSDFLMGDFNKSLRTPGDTLDEMTLRYGSPEEVALKPLSRHADIWRLGVVFLEMAAKLKGSSAGHFHNFIQTHGSKQPYYHANLAGVQALIIELEKIGKPTDNVALAWSQSMITFDPGLRPSASWLIKSITSDGKLQESEWCCRFCYASLPPLS
jgi:tRNA A-37 threonylcarbamoyl transferase component Bud32